MPVATLRNVGGSVVMAIPRSLLDLVGLQAGALVDVAVQQGSLLITPQRKKHYKLAELLAQCDPSLPLTPDEQAWHDMPPVGLEN